MADITKCPNSGCTIKKNCYRWTAEPSMHQSWQHFTQDVNGECEFMIPIEDEEEEKEEKFSMYED